MKPAHKDAEMGKVTVDIELSNYRDREDCEAGKLGTDKVRAVKLSALVDTGSTMLIAPAEVIKILGLHRIRTTRSRIADGKIIERGVYGPARLALMGREVLVEVAEGPSSIPVLLGQIPLESLDFHIDPKGQRLIPNPESPDMALIDIF